MSGTLAVILAMLSQHVFVIQTAIFSCVLLKLRTLSAPQMDEAIHDG